jgi:capsular exopolysaccharide synthesis family protein
MGLSTVVVFNFEPRYSATAELVLDTRVQRLAAFEVLSGPLGTLQDAVPIIRSEAQRLRSPALAAEVVDTLQLNQTAEFSQRPGVLQSLSDQITSIFPSSAAWLAALPMHQPGPELQKTALIDAYLKHLTVVNDGRSFTMLVKFWASDPYLAAKIANVHVQRYVDAQHALKAAAATRALALLNNQVQRLRADLVSKERDVRTFKEVSGLLQAQGSTLLAQQISRSNDELSKARAELAQREARMTEALHALAQKESQSDVLQSRLIQELRLQQAEASRVLAGLNSQYDAHSPVQRLAQAKLADIQQQIASETTRIVNSMRSDVAVAQQRVDNLSRTLTGLEAKLIAEDKAEGQISEMERDIDAERGVYRDVMGRQQQIEAEAGAETSDARLVSAALPPSNPEFPNKKLLLSLSLVLSIVSGCGLAYFIDRKNAAIGRLQDLDNLGSVALLPFIPLVTRRERGGSTLPDYMVDKPSGEFADAVRSLRGDIMHLASPGGARVLAITSALPGEGKTTMSLTLARSLAALDLRVLVIDCDLRRSQMKSMLGGGGLIAALQGHGSLDELMSQDPRSSVKLLAAERHVVAPQDLLGGASLGQILATARKRFDFVILDTPPEGAVSDVLLVAPHVDATILLVRWKATPVRAVTRSMMAFEARGVEVSGIVLNGVDIAELARSSGQYNLYSSTRKYHQR